MTDEQRTYPDNSAIFARKAEGRRQRAALSFAEKLVALDALKARTEPIARAREERKRFKPAPTPGES
jgi:hypothetical protein